MTICVACLEEYEDSEMIGDTCIGCAADRDYFDELDALYQDEGGG